MPMKAGSSPLSMYNLLFVTTLFHCPGAWRYFYKHLPDVKLSSLCGIDCGSCFRFDCYRETDIGQLSINHYIVYWNDQLARRGFWRVLSFQKSCIFWHVLNTPITHVSLNGSYRNDISNLYILKSKYCTRIFELGGYFYGLEGSKKFCPQRR